MGVVTLWGILKIQPLPNRRGVLIGTTWCFPARAQASHVDAPDGAPFGRKCPFPAWARISIPAPLPPVPACPMPPPTLACLVPPLCLHVSCPSRIPMPCTTSCACMFHALSHSCVSHAPCTHKYVFPHTPSSYLHAPTEGAVVWAWPTHNLANFYEAIR